MNPTTQQPTYELLKDLPYLKAGATYKMDGFEYLCTDGEFTNGLTNDRLSTKAVEGNPDWFRRVEVKDWEVECVVIGNKNYWKQKNGLYHNGIFDQDEKLEQLLRRGGKIHSVRRLSDGETFTVGEHTTGGTIHSFMVLDSSVDFENSIASNLSHEKNRGCMAVRFDGIPVPNRILSNISKLPSSPPVEQETIKVDEKSKIFSQLDMYNMGYKDAIKYMDAIISEAQRKAFEAAREYNTNPNTFYPKPIFEPRLTYPTFADYIQSLKK